jgi:Glycosyltransferase family 87
MLNFHAIAHRFELPPGSAESGSSLMWALNGTLLVAAAAAALWLWHFARRRDLSRANHRLQRFVLSTPILLVLILSGSFNLVTASYLGYEVPRDLLQDVESAKLWLQGRPAFPLNMTADIRDTLNHEPPPPSADRWIPGLSQIEQTSARRVQSEPWAQAHPASMTLLLALFVPWLHVRLIQLLFGFASLAALAGTIRLLSKGLNFTPRLSAVLFWGLVGWFPFWVVIRNGQVGMILTFLMTLGWYLLRQERDLAAGISLGVATALKLFPALVLVYLLFRRRKAFWPGALAASTLLLLSFSLVGWHNTLDYFRVVHFVQSYYRDYKANLSLLSVFTGIAPLARFAPVLAQISFVALLGLLLYTITRKSRDAGPATLDLEYAMFMALLPILSPVSWDHYLVILTLPLAVLISCLCSSSVFPERRWWSLGFLFAAAVLAVPQPFSAWMAGVLRLSRPIILLKLPVAAVFAIFALLWGMRMHLALPPSALKFPPTKTESEDSTRSAA